MTFRHAFFIDRGGTFTDFVSVTMISQRRTLAPFGLEGGAPGRVGENSLNGAPLPGNFSISVRAGDRLRIETPGGGGFGSA